ncbi:ketoreductase [Histoplasma capsulatum G186AR]|uniref:Ketoreductase n=1 Tax=Ajellomyces capsulatus (strain G186AR / H82 / ATCC MYA-2454 / RMSCC 2432) TaxID=447093 RepID=C0NUH1_AJECG|nr:ketoreductase [Histoplasma capsulatum G186AR]EEH05051.1 ketoreductase [Histoplasma capsulatum G186AR]
MTRILLTGGSGFIAAHVLDALLHRGHSVVTTVRSEEKARKIRDSHPDVPKDKLDFAIVEDIAKLDGNYVARNNCLAHPMATCSNNWLIGYKYIYIYIAFDEAVIADPPFEVVIHTASPFHFRADNNQTEYLDPAINGTVGILRAIKRSAPTVKHVVITSSFAAIIDAKKPPTYKYSEADWNPITEAEALLNPIYGYRASKTFAERAAWEFVENEKPNFTVTTINPPVVLGPVIHHVDSFATLNTSNERIRDLITGAGKHSCPPTGTYLWVDVRDVALAHILAAEKQKEAANQRFFVTAGNFSNRQVAGIIYEEFPQLREKLPVEEDALKPGDFPAEGYSGFDNERSRDVLGLEYRSLRQSVVDTVKSLLEIKG